MEKELMIDDIIQIKADDDYYQPLKVGSVEFDDLWCAMYNFERCEWENAYDGFGYDMVEPIPLTAEILMRNGFEKRVEEHKITSAKKANRVHYKTRYELVQNPCTPMVNIISVCVIGKTSIKYHSKNGEWIKGINLRLQYVHELQHALRLCGLNELADNFKVE